MGAADRDTIRRPDSEAVEPTLSLEPHFYGSVTVGERGQVVIPADARRDTGISPGDRLLVFRHPFGGGVMLAKLDSVHETMRNLHQILAQLDTAAEGGLLVDHGGD